MRQRVVRHVDARGVRVGWANGARDDARRRRRRRVVGGGDGARAVRGEDVYDATYAMRDRDYALDIAERSHATRARAAGDEWFYGELAYGDARRVLRRAARVVGWDDDDDDDDDAESTSTSSTAGEFVDLGSGMGKMVTCAALTGLFARSRGVELLPELHDEASAALETFYERVRDAGTSVECSISLSLGNLLTFDVSNADVIYIHATCFTPELLHATAMKLANECKSGTRVLIMSKQLPEGWVFEAFDGGYMALAQPQTHWKLDCWMYEVRRGSSSS